MPRLKCQKCGHAFDGRSDAKYCSGSCRAAAAKERAQSRNQAQPGGTRRRSSVLTSAITRSVRKAARTPADGAAVALARVYARQIDSDPDQLGRLGPQLLSTLVQLGMTPKARSAESIKGEPDEQRSALDELRARRADRAHRAAAVDPSAS